MNASTAPRPSGLEGTMVPRLGHPAPVRHPIHPLLRERWSPRAFADRPVSAEALALLFEAARWAPSSYNQQPWAFLVARRGEEAFSAHVDGLVPGNRAWAARAPVLALSVAQLSFDRDGSTNRHALHDVGLATAQILFQATSMGLLGHPMAGIDVEAVRLAHTIPESWEPVAAIALGYPPEASADQPSAHADRPRQRKALGDFVFTGSWGRPADLLERAESGEE